MSMLEKKPEHRPDSAAAVASVLAGILLSLVQSLRCRYLPLQQAM